MSARRWQIASGAALIALAACGCGARSYGRGLRRVAPFGVRAGWVDFRDFELTEVEDRPLVGVYLRMSDRGSAVFEVSADAALDTDEPDARQFYAGALSVLYFPTKHGGAYLHAGGGGLYESTELNDYLDAYATAGVGYSVPAGPTRIDLRASYWRMIDSANAGSAAVVTLGYGF